jgi:adenosylcobyric acid synthase
MSALMIQGVSSSAGKSLLVTALARWIARRGVRVAPFKGQNMSNNARVVDGGEIGVAQYLQARAARIRPDVRMNPVLVKPEGDTRSQVVVNGRADLALSALPWRERGARLWPPIERALHELLAEYDVVLLEGAGSPAEINLLATDLANMRSARVADAAVVLVGDIDRGGVFAHLYGTWSLLGHADRRRVRGFVLNRFRGDPELLAPALQLLEERTGVPTLGALPQLVHGLPDEDGASTPQHSGDRPRVAVVRYPTASNLDEFRPLEQVADLVWARAPADLDGATLVVLPGSKHVAADRAWLQTGGFDEALRVRVARGDRILAICGGLQLAGERFEDAAGVDGSGAGIGILPLRTTFSAHKLVRRRRLAFAALPKPWSALSGVEFDGYEIRHGASEPVAPLVEAIPGGLGWIAGTVLAVYPHGLFDQEAAVKALLGAAPAQSLDRTFDVLADVIDEHLDMTSIAVLAGVA